MAFSKKCVRSDYPTLFPPSPHWGGTYSNSKSLSVPHFAAGIQLVLGNPALLTVYQHCSSMEVCEAHSGAP